MASERKQTGKSGFLISLRIKLIFWALAFIVPILLLLFFSNVSSTRQIEQQLQNNVQQILKPYSARIDSIMYDAKRYVANKAVSLTFLETENDELILLKMKEKLAEGLYEDLAVHDSIDAIFLKTGDSFYILLNYNRDYPEHKRVADALNSGRIKTDPNEEDQFRKGYQYLILDKGCYFYIQHIIPGGVIGCWFSEETLLEPMIAAEIEGIRGLLISDDSVQKRHLPEGENLIISEALQTSPYSLSASLDIATFFAARLRMQKTLLFSFLAACILFLLYLLYLHFSINKPLYGLVETINSINHGDFPIEWPNEYRDVEIEAVFSALRNMMGQIEDLKIKIYEEELIKQHIQMELFQLQIRPHFFLNALNTIISFSRTKDYESVNCMTMHLARHSRFILYNNWYVSLEEEIEYTRNYVDMHCLQYNQNVSYRIDVDESTLDWEVPILSVQVFVENSLKFSRNREEPLEISIRSVGTTGPAGLRELLIEIDDTGIGFSPKTLRELSENAPAPRGDEYSGIGIANVRARYDILYEGHYTLAFSNNQSGGAHVEIHLPERGSSQ